MPAYTKHLNLIKPDEPEFFNINTWNANMNTLDEAYAIIEGEVVDLEATVDAEGNQVIIPHKSGIYYVEVNAPTTLYYPSYSIIHYMLAFDTEVYDVKWKKTIPSAKNIIWDAGEEPTWEASSVYEVSILHGHAIAYKRNNNIPNGVDE